MKKNKVTIIKSLFLFALFFISHFDKSFAQGIIKSTPEDYRSIIAAVGHTKPVVVHMSSTDRSCGFCTRNNEHFKKVASKLQDKFIFVQVNFNPWRSFIKNKKIINHYSTIKMPLTGLPTMYIYYKGYAISYQVGAPKKLEEALKKEYLRALSLMDTKEKGVEITQIATSELSSFLKKSSKLTVIHLTSTDNSCKHCTWSNQFISLAAKKLNNKYQFAQVVYNPWDAIRNDLPFLSAIYKKGVRVQGLPVTLVFQNEKVKWSMAGASPNIYEHLQKLSNIN